MPILGAFVGAVSLAGAQPGLWAVSGGNYRVPELLLKRSKAKLVRSSVSKIKVVEGDGERPRYIIESRPTSSRVAVGGQIHDQASQVVTSEYDIVIIAAPYVSGRPNIKIEGLDDPESGVVRSLPRPYQLIISTFVKGELNYGFLRIKKGAGSPQEILTVNQENNFNSVALQRPTNHETGKPVDGVYKVCLLCGTSSLSGCAERDSLYIRYFRTMCLERMKCPNFLLTSMEHQSLQVSWPTRRYSIFAQSS